MTTWRDLWRQRLRWHRGALENIGAYGLTRATAMYWGQQLGLAYGVVALPVVPAADDRSRLLAADSIRWSPFWIGIGADLRRRADRHRRGRAGWRGRALAAPIFLELGYAVFLQACFVDLDACRSSLGRKAGWNYVPRPALPAVLTPLLLATGLLTTWGILLPRIGPDDRLVHRPGVLGRVQHPRLRLPQRPPPAAADASPTKRRERRATRAARGPRCRLIPRARAAATTPCPTTPGLRPTTYSRWVVSPLAVSGPRRYHSTSTSPARLDDPDHERRLVQDEVEVDLRGRTTRRGGGPRLRRAGRGPATRRGRAGGPGPRPRRAARRPPGGSASTTPGRPPTRSSWRGGSAAAGRRPRSVDPGSVGGPRPPSPARGRSPWRRRRRRPGTP